jgi:hypothetical protein
VNYETPLHRRKIQRFKGKITPVYYELLGTGEAAGLARIIEMALADREALAACCARARIYAATQRRRRNFASEVLRLCA